MGLGEGGLRSRVPGVSPWHLCPCSHWLLLTTTDLDARQGSGGLSDLCSVSAQVRGRVEDQAPHTDPQYRRCPSSRSIFWSQSPRGQVGWSLGWGVDLELRSCRDPVGPWVPSPGLMLSVA